MILKAFQRSLSRGDVWSVGRRGFLGGFWNSVSKVMTADALASKITLYSAMENKGIGSIADNGWKTFNDQDYGGSSHCEAKIMHESLGINNAAILDESVEADTYAFHDSITFARLSGNIKISEEAKEKAEVVGGFCAFKGEIQGAAVDLRDYQGLEITMRTNRHMQSFTLNMGTYTLIQDDIYQLKIELTSGLVDTDAAHKSDRGMWKKILVPFNMFHLTARGIARETQRSNDSLRVESLGFLFKESDVNSATPGATEMYDQSDFQLDIHSVVAIPA